MQSAFKRGLHGVTIELCTGAGKSKIIAEIARLCIAKGGRVLVAVNRDELVSQLFNSLVSIGLFPNREQGKDHASPLSNLVVASIPSMQRNRLQKWNKDHFRLIITDEVHFAAASTFKATLGHFESVYHLGVTATLERHDKKGLFGGFEENVFSYTLQDAWRDGWLVEFDFEELPVPIEISDDVAKKKMFTEADETGVFEKGDYLPRLFEAAASSSRGYHGLLFWPNCASSIEANKHFESSDIQSRHVEGEGGPAGITKSQIRETLDWFAEPGPKCLHNADLLSYGYDNPLVDLVGIMRLSRSMGMLKQRLGRGTRAACPVDMYESALDRRCAISFSSKPKCRVLDLMVQLGAVKNTFADATALITDNEEEREFLREERKSGKVFTREEFENKLKARRDGDKDKALAKLADDAANAAQKSKANKYGPYIAHILKSPLTHASRPASEKQKDFLRMLGFNGIAPSSWHAGRIIDCYLKHRQKEEYSLR